MKILLLAKDSTSSKYMFNAINKEFEISKIIFESGINKKTLLKRRMKRLGFFRVFSQLLFQVIIVKILRFFSKKRINEITKEFNFDETELDNNKITRVESANSKEAISIVNEMNPDVIIVNGTRILSSKFLKSSKAVILNTHVGITPKYRGVHGGYWALANNDIENFGVTVHLIDKGIDTGDIIYQGTVTKDPKDNFITYPLLQLNKGIDLMKKALLDVKKDNLKPYKKDLNSKLWYHPTIFQYIYYRVFKGVK